MENHCDILIVDDEPIVGQRLKALLEKEGHRVEAFIDSAVALQRLDTQHFDIVISDIRMGDIDGIQLLDQVLKKFRHIKVVLITGYATLELARESLAKGAFDFIAKPFKLNEIRTTIKRAMESIVSQQSSAVH
ncbi:MAG: response regulator [Desulfocapsaceae bacterium]|nr:response regulator [Desulfocapsaceae bacterium]